LIETENQRRWWFATHPEFSSKKSGSRRRSSPEENQESEKVPPEQVDAMVDEKLKYERDRVVRELLKLMKFWFGTEFESKSPEEKYDLLWGDDDEFTRHRDESDKDRRSGNLTDIPGASTQASDEDKGDLQDANIQRSLEALRQTQELDKKGLESDPHTLLDLLPLRRMVTAPVEAAKALLRGTAQGQVINAVKKKSSGARLPPKGTPERAKIEAARNRGIRAKRREELADIRAGGKGSGVWTEKELERIRELGEFPSDVRWHHDPAVANRPDLAHDPRHVYPVRGGTKGHLWDGHHGNWRN